MIARLFIALKRSAIAVNKDFRSYPVPDAHRGDGKRYVVRTDKKLTAFLPLEAATQAEQPIG